MNLSDIISSQYINEVEYMCIRSNTYKNKLYISITYSYPLVTVFVWQWFSLSDVKRGRVHLALEWLPTVTQPEKLQQVGRTVSHPPPISVSVENTLMKLTGWFICQVLMYQSKSSYMNKTVPTAALLFVYLERAHELPVSMTQMTSLKYLICSLRQ